tara:strand:+ start:751 stop:1008 length:258 start_codon:yes stop_codon:yes gene_type:complete
MEVIPSIEEMVDSMDETEMNKRYNSSMSIGFTVHHAKEYQPTKREQLYGLLKRVIDILVNDEIHSATGDLLDDTIDSEEELSDGE